MAKGNSFYSVEVTNEDIGAMDFGQAADGGDIPRSTYKANSKENQQILDGMEVAMKFEDFAALEAEISKLQKHDF